MADVKGSGIPLAFLLVSTSKKAPKGAKQAILQSFLGELKKLGVDPEYTDSDKDFSEINAMRLTWPNAKHQLCFWHGLRAIKTRFKQHKTTPAFYDVKAAREMFDFIDPLFLPVVQAARNGSVSSIIIII